MFRSILVPLDTSAYSEQAVAKAVAIARVNDAELLLTLVHTPMPLAVEGGQTVDMRRYTQERAYLERYMQRVAADLKKRYGLRVKVALLYGNVVESLVEHAREEKVDLIVISTHGRTGLSRAWLGSVADGLMRQATVPVLMLRPGQDAPERAPDAAEAYFQRILIPLDGSPAAEGIVEQARALSRGTDTAYILIRVVEPVQMLPPVDVMPPDMLLAGISDPEATQRLVLQAEQQLATLARRLKNEGLISVTTRVHVGANVAPAIVELVHSYHADLVAMTTHGRGASRLIVGSVADKVLRGTDCPVLFYRPCPRRSAPAG